eukprot:35437-Eustigmatos_ZCMA.PRE.1
MYLADEPDHRPLTASVAAVLMQCVVSLLRKDGAHVPYRSCKLTNLLKDSIGGNCLTVMIACIWGEAAQVEETISTLR